MVQLTKEQAIQFAKSGNWKKLDFRALALFCLSQKLLCVPFDKVHEAVEVMLKRPVFTHEFAHPEHLMEELLTKL